MVRNAVLFAAVVLLALVGACSDDATDESGNVADASSAVDTSRADSQVADSERLEDTVSVEDSANPGDAEPVLDDLDPNNGAGWTTCQFLWRKSCSLLVQEEPCGAPWANAFYRFFEDSGTELTQESCEDYTFRYQCLGPERSLTENYSYYVPQVEARCREAVPALTCENSVEFDACVGLAEGTRESGEFCIMGYDCIDEGETCIASLPYMLPVVGTGECGPVIAIGEPCLGVYDCGPDAVCFSGVCKARETTD